MISPEKAALFRGRLAALTTPLPGSLPYDNARRLFVQQRYEGLPLLQFCCERHPHLGRDYWQGALEAGRISYQGQLADGSERVTAGGVLVHTILDTVEPAVNPALQLLYEDDALVALHKPAPLPVHACGRFNKNTVMHLLSLVWPDSTFKPVHRLDANTTGVMVLAKSKAAARDLAEQFSKRRVEKRYLVEVHGEAPSERFEVDAAVTDDPGVAGSRRAVTEGLGRPAHTSFTLRAAGQDGRSLLEARPSSGRTNQIRIHLAELGLPIVGDSTYGRDDLPLGADETLTTAEALHLHAWRLRLRSPATGTPLELEARPPPWAQLPARPPADE